MTDIASPDWLDIFIGRQNIDNVRPKDGNINFDVSISDLDTETEKKSDPRSISQSDIEDIQGFFSSPLQSRPFAKHLLQILWIREVKFSMKSLRDDDVYDFVRGAFALYGIDIDEDTVEDELLELVYEGYIQETNAGFSLTWRGRSVAEEMFKALKMFVPAHVESSSITAVGDGITQLANEIAACLKKASLQRRGNSKKSTNQSTNTKSKFALMNL